MEYAFFVGVCSLDLFFLDAAVYFLLLVVRFHEVKVVALCRNAVEVVCVRCIEHFRACKVDFISAVRHIVVEHYGDNRSDAVAVHLSAFQHVDVPLAYSCVRLV